MLESPCIRRYNGDMSEPSPRENLSGADNEQGSLTGLAWLAGLLDGEGWIGLIRAKRSGKTYQRYTASVSITTTSERIAARADEVMRENNIHLYNRYRGAYIGTDGSPRRPKWEISVRSNRDTAALIRLVLPFLTEKRVCAELTLAYAEWRLAQSAKTGTGSKNVVPSMRERGEATFQLLRQDRNRHDPSTTTRLAPIDRMAVENLRRLGYRIG